MDTPNEMRTKIVERAETDATFRAQLLEDPKGAVEAELGVKIPPLMAINVHEESAETAHLVLPPASKLSEGDLQAVTGGRWISQAINREIARW